MPEVWERYVKEVDSEQEMWLNSFTKAPLRIPMPSELEYLWEKGAVSRAWAFDFFTCTCVIMEEWLFFPRESGYFVYSYSRRHTRTGWC